jgi:antitoxin MazE
MRIAIRRIGNSKGVIIPASLLAQSGMDNEAELTIEEGALVMRAPAKPVRSGWAQAAKVLAETGDDALLLPEFANMDDAELAW